MRKEIQVRDWALAALKISDGVFVSTEMCLGMHGRVNLYCSHKQIISKGSKSEVCLSSLRIALAAWIHSQILPFM